MTSFSDDKKPQQQNLVFSDSDLKQLKGDLTSRFTSGVLDLNKIMALLARLEAADDFSEHCAFTCSDCIEGNCDTFQDLREVWLKKAGKNYL